MVKLRFFIGLVVFLLGSNTVVADDSNPFAKSKDIDLNKTEWVIEGKTARKSGFDSGTFYHLFYDKKQLRLRMTESAEDNEASAKKYDTLAIEDVLIDGKRVPLFSWCLQNQQRHARFLQQGLSVRNNICVNDGAKGAFTMRLNVATLKSLQEGATLSFIMSPFRSSVTVNFYISDFSAVVEKLSNKKAVKVVAKTPEKAPIQKVKEASKCKAKPPIGFSGIKTIEYNCDDAVSKNKANADVAESVSKERERRKKVAEEARTNELAARKAEEEKLAAKKTELAAKKAAEEKLAAEKAALAASAAQVEVIGSEISNKMIAVCKKKWATGEHRCYCEKYIEHAPAGIESNPAC